MLFKGLRSTARGLREVVVVEDDGEVKAHKAADSSMPTPHLPYPSLATPTAVGISDENLFMFRIINLSFFSTAQNMTNLLVTLIGVGLRLFENAL